MSENKWQFETVTVIN